MLGQQVLNGFQNSNGGGNARKQSATKRRTPMAQNQQAGVSGGQGSSNQKPVGSRTV